MKKYYLAIIIIIAIVIIAIVALFSNVQNGLDPTPTPTSTIPTSTINSDVKVLYPKANENVISPVNVVGEARGSWFFEASFPIRLETNDGKVLANSYVTALSDWMTVNFVPFQGQLSYILTTSTSGKLILEADNPSGLPENSKQISIPVQIQANPSPVIPTSTVQRTIKLFYYNPEKDKDASGNIMCTSKGLEAVNRIIPSTITPIQDAVRLLLRGELTAQEKAAGITTEYPLNGFVLTGASNKDGMLTLSFDDPSNRTNGGSCRIAILWAQIEATAKQFSGIYQVKFKPESLFQP